MNKMTTIVINFLIFDSETRKFLIQKRSPDRPLFPNRWEIPGGHLEDGETISECIERELLEELSMTLTGITGKIHEFFWKTSPSVKDEIYIITAVGVPQLEDGKATEYRWIDRGDAHLLIKEGMETSDPYEAIIKSFDFVEGTAPILPHGFADLSYGQLPHHYAL